MRIFFIIYAVFVVGILVVFGFRGSTSGRPPIEVFPDMDRQFKFKPQSYNTIFEDGRDDRPVPPGTVPTLAGMQEEYEFRRPFDYFRGNPYLMSGKIGEVWGEGYPVTIDNSALQRGQELYNINCSICHGASGDGKGVTANYQGMLPANLLLDRYVDMPEGQIFNTITYGFNTMGPYGAKIRPEDRWKVVAYVRALQLAANAPAEAVPSDQRGALGL